MNAKYFYKFNEISENSRSLLTQSKVLSKSLERRRDESHRQIYQVESPRLNMTSMLNQAVRTIKPTDKGTAITTVTDGGGIGRGGAFTRKLSPVVSTRLHSPLS